MTKAAELAKMGEVLTNSQIGGRRNLIINGAMQVAQRGTSSAIGGGQAYHSVDRFIAQAFGADNFSGTLEQSTTVPSGQGFSNSLKYNIATAESAIDANELFDIRYKIEAQDLQQLANGTSSAKKITLSFWVRSHVTGTYSISINKLTNTTRLYPVLYTITSADTWEKKEIVIPGDTSGGGIDNSNEAGFQIVWGLSVSSTFNDGTGTNNQWQDYSNGAAFKGHTANAVGTQGAFYITGLQMEVGSQATPFEHRSFGEELALCQRYLFNGDLQCLGSADGAGNIQLCVQTPVNLRANPTLVSFSSPLRGALTATATGAAFSAMVAPRATISVTNTGSVNTLVAGFGGSCSVHLDSEL